MNNGVGMKLFLVAIGITATAIGSVFTMSFGGDNKLQEEIVENKVEVATVQESVRAIKEDVSELKLGQREILTEIRKYNGN